MAIEIPKDKWSEFFNDLSKRRFGWETRIEVFNDAVGNQTLSNGLCLNGVDFEEKGGRSEVEISVGEYKKQHQTHIISSPTKVEFVTEDQYHDGAIEITEADGTRTLMRIFNPMPIMVGYSAYPRVTVPDSREQEGKGK